MTTRPSPPRALLASLSLAISAVVCAQSPAPNAPEASAELDALRRRVDDLERRLSGAPPGGVDLVPRQLPMLPTTSSGARSQSWTDVFDVWGFGSVAYLNTGSAGTSPNGAFQVHEATLFVEAHAAEKMSFFFELQTNRLGQDESKFVRTGEAHVHLRDLWRNDDGDSIGLKVGRIDIPFGEEYLWQDAPDNPLITQTAAYPYGFDEGILLYGRCCGVGWLAAVTDGTDERSADDHPSKAVNLKVHGDPAPWLHLSASWMNNGPTGESAIEFGGSHIEPVGAGSVTSTAGDSPSTRVDANLYEIDAGIDVGRFEFDGAVGHATTHDRADAFDRSLTWFFVQGKLRIGDDVFVVLRLSEIGTYDGDEGFHFDGKTIAAGNSAFGFDSSRLQRASAGVGWRPNHATLVKVEVGNDHFSVINASPLDPERADRLFFGAQLTVSF